MNFFDPLLGFAVLTGPLWLILILLPVCIWLAIKIAKRFKQRGAKLGIGLLVFLLVIIIPFADQIAGRVYLSNLCATEAGVKVYQTVELPAEYWDEQEGAKFIKENGDLDPALLGKRFEGRWVSEPYSTFIIKVDKRRWEFRDNDTNKILGEKITFDWHGGWIGELSPAPGRGLSCRSLLAKEFGRDEFIRREQKLTKEFFLNFFKPKPSAK